MEAPNCAQCGSASRQRCSRCHSVYYCSVACQKLHWRSHRSSCRSTLGTHDHTPQPAAPPQPPAPAVPATPDSSELVEHTMRPSLDSAPCATDLSPCTNDITTHRKLLQDSIMTGMYRDAILLSSSLFAGKIVLDVGCGSGILSLFAAKAGASAVYACDVRPLEPQGDSKIAEANGLPGVVHVIASTIEDLAPGQIPPVDIIISEWMGEALFVEGMLRAVLLARDRFLKPGGLLFPSRARLYGAGFSCLKRFTRDIYNDLRTPGGVFFGPEYLNFYLHHCERFKTWRNAFGKSERVTSVAELAEVDLHNCSRDDYESWSAARQVDALGGTLDGLVLWFDVTFGDMAGKPIVLSTSPEEPDTHWSQLIFPILNAKLCTCKKEKLKLSLSWRQVDRLHADMVFSFQGPSGRLDHNVRIQSSSIFKVASETQRATMLSLALTPGFKERVTGSYIMFVGCCLPLSALDAAKYGSVVHMYIYSKEALNWTRRVAEKNGILDKIIFHEGFPTIPENVPMVQGCPFLSLMGTPEGNLEAIIAQIWVRRSNPWTACLAFDEHLADNQAFWEKKQYGFDMGLLAPLEGSMMYEKPGRLLHRKWRLNFISNPVFALMGDYNVLWIGRDKYSGPPINVNMVMLEVRPDNSILCLPLMLQQRLISGDVTCTLGFRLITGRRVVFSLSVTAEGWKVNQDYESSLDRFLGSLVTGSQ